MSENNITAENNLQESTVAKKSKSPSALQILKSVSTVILIIIVAFLAVVAVKIAYDKFIAKKTVPSFAGYSLLWVVTGSMEPTIAEGDLILIKNTGDYWTGDIITFIHPGETIPTTHRIIDFADDTKELYTTRGDNPKNTTDILPVQKDEVFGEVVYVMHNLGMLVSWLVKGGGFVFVLAAVLIIVIAIYLLLDKEKVVNLGEPDNTKPETPENSKENGSAPSGDKPDDDSEKDKPDSGNADDPNPPNNEGGAT